MKKNTTRLLAAAVCVAACASASAQTQYNQDIKNFVDGTGNTTTGYTTTTDSTDGIEIALRANNRTDGTVNNNGANIYTYENGFAPGTTKATWSYSFQIETTAPLSTFTYWIVANGITENITSFYLDNSYGTVNTIGGTPVKVGTTGSGTTYSQISGANNVLANAENITFPPLNGNALAPTQYNFEVYATAATDGSGPKLADTSIIVNVVPDAGSSLTLMGAALTGLGAFASRRRLSK